MEGTVWQVRIWRSEVFEKCNLARKRSGFKSIDFFQAVVLSANEWAPESVLATAAQKFSGRGLHRGTLLGFRCVFVLCWQTEALFQSMVS